MATVRTIFQKDRDQEMPDDEAAMLRAQGLLVEEEPPPADGGAVAGSQVVVVGDGSPELTVPSKDAKEAPTNGGK